eukprot:4217314-Ditylum_brightwellii.AAC.1
MTFPNKYKLIHEAKPLPWSSEQKDNTEWRTKKDVNNVVKYLQVLSSNDLTYCACLLLGILDINQLKTDSCRKKEEKDALNVLLTACTHNMNGPSVYNNPSSRITYHHRVQKKSESELISLQRRCVLDYCHSNDALRIDTNTHRCVKIRGEDGEEESHVGQVWCVLTLRVKYEAFNESDT